MVPSGDGRQPTGTPDAAALRRAIEGSWVRVSAPDGAFTVSVAPGGVLTGLTFGPRAMRSDAGLGTRVTDAVRKAAAEADEALRSVLPSAQGPDAVGVIRGDGPGLDGVDGFERGGRASDPTGLVEAEVGVAGGLRALRIAPGALRLGPERLAAQVLATVRLACARAAAATAAAVEAREGTGPRLDVAALVARYRPEGVTADDVRPSSEARTTTHRRRGEGR